MSAYSSIGIAMRRSEIEGEGMVKGEVLALVQFGKVSLRIAANMAD